MNFFKKILNQCEDDADNRIAILCLMMDILVVIVVVHELLGIFVIKPTILYIASALSILNFTLPFFLYKVFKIHKEWTRYLILCLEVFQVGILYSVMSFHMIMMLAFPLVLSCLYNKQKYVIYTAILSVFMIVISHISAFYLDALALDPLDTLNETILYGILPRLIEFAAMVAICLLITSRIESLIKSLAEKNQEVYDDQANIVVSLSKIIEAQSEDTGGHVKRVSLYTALLCKGLGYSEEDIWKVSLASIMHDVGKISIPKEILEKPGKLTNEEFEVIKTHVEIGRKLLEDAPGEIMQLSKIIAYEHHERWDGNGYLHMKGEEIDKNARCVALADVYDALVSKRPYKKAFEEEEAYNIIVSESGTHFDPKVVEVFIKYREEFKKISQEQLADEETN